MRLATLVTAGHPFGFFLKLRASLSLRDTADLSCACGLPAGMRDQTPSSIRRRDRRKITIMTLMFNRFQPMPLMKAIS